MKKQTRREFLVDSAVMIGGTLGTVAFANGLLFPKTGHSATVQFPEASCGHENKANQKVLVAYASRCGSTGGVAEAIGEVLCDNGTAVDVRLVENVNDVASYSAIIVGSAIQKSKWLPEAMAFVEKNQEVLRQMPVAYFLACLALYEETDENRRKARSFLDPSRDAAPQVQPVDIGLFAGVLDYSKMNLMYRMVMKSKMEKKGVPEGDFRNWNAIRAWAQGLRSKL